MEPAVCDGFGFCADLIPESIQLDEWGFPIVNSDIAPEQMDAARAAVRCCPRRAIRLVAAEERPGEAEAAGRLSGPVLLPPSSAQT